MARPRPNGGDGLRALHRADLARLHVACRAVDPDAFLAQIAAVDRGDVIRCHAFELGLLPPSAVVEVDAAGAVRVIAEPV